MIILIKLFGLLILAMGLTIFAVPQVIQKIFDFIKEGNRIYYAGVIRGAVGIIFFLCSSLSLVPLASIALGIMFLVSGITVFAVEPEKMKSLIAHYIEMPGLVIRLLGLVAASFGILVYSIF